MIKELQEKLENLGSILDSFNNYVVDLKAREDLLEQKREESRRTNEAIQLRTQSLNRRESELNVSLEGFEAKRAGITKIKEQMELQKKLYSKEKEEAMHAIDKMRGLKEKEHDLNKKEKIIKELNDTINKQQDIVQMEKTLQREKQLVLERKENNIREKEAKLQKMLKV